MSQQISMSATIEKCLSKCQSIEKHTNGFIVCQGKQNTMSQVKVKENRHGENKWRIWERRDLVYEII